MHFIPGIESVLTIEEVPVVVERPSIAITRKCQLALHNVGGAAAGPGIQPSHTYFKLSSQ
ncbi:hypothetical protein E2C01_047727 [Portunus trituberculatus]|uniref:Uncharacterized protein n=1 Tax=Portunus trituberculatus TaxID=210409 RepID=A0A5B7G8N7_PORTR|nr:hypothetical protein [Portunus trituberculatus]